MKNVTELAKYVQANGKDCVEYDDLFNIIYQDTILPKTMSFKLQLNGNIEEGIDEGVDLFIELLDKWEGKGNFHTLYKTSFTNRLINLVNYMKRNIRKHNYSYDVSLSDNSVVMYKDQASSSPMIETLNDSSLTTEFDVTTLENRVETLLEEFRKIKPEQADLLDILISTPHDYTKSDFTDAVCVYYGVQKYTSTIQRRVSRAKESFENFLIKNNYYEVAV